MFEVASANPRIMELPIVGTTVIERGELVKFTPGTGVVAVAGTDFDDPCIGVAMENHNGSSAGRQSGTVIKIAVNDADQPLLLKWNCANTITATGGSATTFVVAGLLPQTDDIWNGGYIQVLTCAADSSMVGKRIKISDCTGATGTLTFSTQTAAFAAGDTVRLCPAKLAVTLFGWDLDSDGTNVDWDTSGGEALMLVDADPANMVSYWKIRLSQFASSNLAL